MYDRDGKCRVGEVADSDDALSWLPIPWERAWDGWVGLRVWLAVVRGGVFSLLLLEWVWFWWLGWRGQEGPHTEVTWGGVGSDAIHPLRQGGSTSDPFQSLPGAIVSLKGK